MSDDLGEWGEDRASAFLEGKGWTIQCRNYSTPLGECDIIARDGETLVFVEVKTRHNEQFGPPERAVTREKREHIRRVAKAVLADLDGEVSCRFDVVAIEGFGPGEETELRHIENAFEGRE